MFDKIRQGVVDVIRGDSPIIADQLDQIRRVVDQLGNAGQPNVVLNLQRVPIIDSAGLEFLLDTFDSFREQGGNLKLVQPTQLVREILTVTGVEQFFEVFENETAAVGSFTR